jgi:hypothetical protein
MPAIDCLMRNVRRRDLVDSTGRPVDRAGSREAVMALWPTDPDYEGFGWHGSSPRGVAPAKYGRWDGAVVHPERS